MITFVVQNETHALNFAPIVDRLLTLGIPECKLQTLHLDPIFGLRTIDIVSIPNQKVVDLEIAAPYYYLSRLGRLRWLLSASSQLRKCVETTAVLIIGSDGGIQRLMANSVRAKEGKAIMLMDGLLHPWPQNERLKCIIKRDTNRFAALFDLNHLLPADVGHSNLDLIYVMNSTAKKLLMSQGVKTRIEVVSLPRFDAYTREFKQLRSAYNSCSKHCLYATGSYEWHGLFKEAKQQEQDLADLNAFAAEHRDWRVRIRVHPREKADDYVHRNWAPNVEISHSDRTVLEDLAWASVLATVRSTIAVEAEMVGVPVLIYTRNFGPPESGSYFEQNNYFQKSDGFEDVLTLGQQVHKAKDIRSSVEEIAGAVREFFDEYANESITTSEVWET